jgi:hypothetical protein
MIIWSGRLKDKPDTTDLYERIDALTTRVRWLENQASFRILKYPYTFGMYTDENSFYKISVCDAVNKILNKLGVNFSYEPGTPETITLKKVSK